jgi:hypothetical protein
MLSPLKLFFSSLYFLFFSLLFQLLLPKI